MKKYIRKKRTSHAFCKNALPAEVSKGLVSCRDDSRTKSPLHEIIGGPPQYFRGETFPLLHELISRGHFPVDLSFKFQLKFAFEPGRIEEVSTFI